MSTYYYMVCDAHKEITDAASKTAGGWCPLGDATLTLYGFIVCHARCNVRIIDEHEQEEKVGGEEETCEGVKWKNHAMQVGRYEQYREWTQDNAREMYDGERA